VHARRLYAVAQPQVAGGCCRSAESEGDSVPAACCRFHVVRHGGVRAKVP